MEVEEMRLRGGGWQPVTTVRRLLATNALLRHNVLLLGSTIATGMVSYLFHPIVGHLLGSAQYGVVLSIISLFGILLNPTGILLTVFNKFTADLSAQGRTDQVNYLLRVGTRYGLIVGTVGAGVVIALSPLLAQFLKLASPQPIMIMAISVVFSLAGLVTNGAIQGRQEFGWLGLLSFVSVVLRVGLVAMLVIWWGLVGAIWGLVLSGMLNYALSWLPLRSVLRSPKERIASFKPLVKYSLTTALAAIGGALLFNTDTLLAKHYLSPTGAGYYAALVTIGRIVLFVSASCGGVMFPKVTAMRQQGGDPRAILAWTVAGSFALSASVVLVFLLFPGQLIGLIFHAPSQVTGQLFWYGVAMLMYALASVLMTYFLSLGRMAFVFVQLACCGLQAGLIVAWHGSLAHIVMAMVVVMAALLCGMIVLYVQQIWSDHKAVRPAGIGGHA